MTGNRRDSSPQDGPDIELLDIAGPSSSKTAVESVASPGRSRSNTLLALGAFALVAGGIAALAAGGPEESATPTTQPPSTAPTTAPSTSTTILDRTGVSTASVGAGPIVVWQQVDVDTAATTFSWVGDQFVGVDRDSLIGLQPQCGGARTTIYAGSGPAGDLGGVVSSREVVVDQRDQLELLFFEPGQPRIVIDPPLELASDLITLRTTRAAERRGDDVIVLETWSGMLNLEALRDRTGIATPIVTGLNISASTIEVFGPRASDTVVIAETDLTAADLAALRTIDEPIQRISVGPVGGRAEPVEVDISRANWLAVIGDEFLVGGAELWRSFDGVTWEQAGDDTPQFGGLLPPGPDGVLTGLAFDTDAGFLTTSVDAGRTWQRTARVIDNTWEISSVAPIVAMTGWPGDPFSSPGTVPVFTATHELRIFEAEERFELFDRSGELLLGGSIIDPASGFRFVLGAPDLWFEDPDTGEEIARFELDLFSRAFAAAETNAGNPQLLALADLSSGSSAQEWSLTPIHDVFGPDALAADLTAGDGWFLADVITTTGRDLYVASASPTECN